MRHAVTCHGPFSCDLVFESFGVLWKIVVDSSMLERLSSTKLKCISKLMTSVNSIIVVGSSNHDRRGKFSLLLASKITDFLSGIS